MADRIYANAGNQPLLNLLTQSSGSLLDVGCGAGDNAKVLQETAPGIEVSGITFAQNEAELAAPYLKRCWVFDLEGPLPEDLAAESFDILMFSHILEHLRDPPEQVRRFSRLLRKNGELLIAIPNILTWKMRMQFLRGDFTYQSSGHLDDTHLRFVTYNTADQYLLSLAPDLKVTQKLGHGSVPLWWLRRRLLSRQQSEKMDAWGSRRWPNLFGSQVLIHAVKS